MKFPHCFSKRQKFREMRANFPLFFRLLVFGSIQNCVGLACALIGYFILVTFSDERLVACSFYSMPLPQALNGGYIMTAMVAIIRYHPNILKKLLLAIFSL